MRNHRSVGVAQHHINIKTGIVEKHNVAQQPIIYFPTKLKRDVQAYLPLEPAITNY